MINLIPPESKKQIITEYWIRVFSVYGFLVVEVVLAVSLLLLPTYVLLKGQLVVLENKTQIESQDNNKFTEFKNTLNDANNIAFQLLSTQDAVQVSEIIKIINDEANKFVQMTSLSISGVSEGAVPVIQLRGKTMTRDDLLQFSAALEQLPVVASANVPISDLARGENFPFSLNLILSETIFE